MSETTAQPMGFTDERLPGSHHVCLIYDNEDERRRVVTEFLEAGLGRGELVSYFADTTPHEAVRGWMRDGGVDVRAAEERGAFRVVPTEAAYCPSGAFEPREVIGRILERYQVAEKAGFTGSRVGSEMTWALRGFPGADRFLEYEALLNTLDTHYPHCGMCQYDASRFDGATLFKVLQVHPFVVARGQIVRNPSYVTPEEFLGRAAAARR